MPIHRTNTRRTPHPPRTSIRTATLGPHRKQPAGVMMTTPTCFPPFTPFSNVNHFVLDKTLGISVGLFFAKLKGLNRITKTAKKRSLEKFQEFSQNLKKHHFLSVHTYHILVRKNKKNELDKFPRFFSEPRKHHFHVRTVSTFFLGKQKKEL